MDDLTQMDRHETKTLEGEGQSGTTSGTAQRQTGSGQGQSGQTGGYAQTGQGQGDTGQAGTHDWDSGTPGDMARGGQTDPAQPDGTTPLERDQRPINQSR